MPQVKKIIWLNLGKAASTRLKASEYSDHAFIVEALENPQVYSGKLEAELMQEREKVKYLTVSRTAAQRCLAETSQKLSSPERKADMWYKELCSLRQALKCVEAKKASLEEEVNTLHHADTKNVKDIRDLIKKLLNSIESLMRLEKDNKELRMELTSCLEQTESRHQIDQEKIATLQEDLRPDEHHIQHNEAEISQKHAAAQKRQEKAQERADEIARTEIILDREKVGKLKGKELQTQFEAFKAGSWGHKS
jgi:chromosome segregation ATPase